MASGGLSHFPGTDRYASPDFEFDRALLELLAEGRGGELAAVTGEELDKAGNVELRTWITLLGAVGDGARAGVLLRAVLASRQRRGGVAAVERSEPHYTFPPAAAYRLNRCLHSLKSDPAFRERYVADAQRVMDEAGLDDPTRAALVRIDRDGLVARGAHPYLVFMAELRLPMAREPGTFEEF